MVLRAELETSGRVSGLLFPSPYKREPTPLTNVYDALRRCAALAGIDKHVTQHTFRHSYCAARLQTTESSARGPVPVSHYTVMAELGHRNIKMVEHVYGHMDDKRFRSSEVQFLREAEWQALVAVPTA
jgi:integrase